MSAVTPEMQQRSLEPANWADLDLVKALLGDDTITEVSVAPWTVGGGLSGDANVVTLTRGDATEKLFLKTTKPTGLEMSKAVGLAREGVFLGKARTDADLSRVFPRIAYGFGDIASARKVVLMQCVDGVQAGFFYGPSSLHNWGKDLAEQTKDYGKAVDERVVTLACFRTAADLHARYWGQPDKAIAELPELRGTNWHQGQGEEQFHAVLAQATNGWALVKSGADAVKDVKLDDQLVAVVDAALAKTTWPAFQEMWSGVTKTVAHNDFHPSNIIIPRPEKPFDTAPVDPEALKVLLVDWEVVGISSGPQDLGQFHISHSSPEARRATCDEALAFYQARLAERGVNVTLEAVKQEYVFGGLARWIWLLSVIMALGLPTPALQFFHDQVAAFIKDHGVTAENAPVVRV